jgi:hypothetical protein
MDLMGDYARRFNPGGGNPAMPQYNTGGNGQAMPSPMTGGYDQPSQFHPQMGGHMPPPFMPQMPGYDSSGINPHGMYTGGPSLHRFMQFNRPHGLASMFRQ